MNKFDSEKLLRKLFEVFNSVNLKYVVMRNYEKYPFEMIKPDIGILIASEHAYKLEQAVSITANALGMSHYKKASATNIISHFITDCNHDGDNWCDYTIKIDARNYEVFRYSSNMKKVSSFNYKVFYSDIEPVKIERNGSEFYVYSDKDQLVSLSQHWRRKQDKRHFNKIVQLLEDDDIRLWYEESTSHAFNKEQYNNPHSKDFDFIIKKLVSKRWGIFRGRFLTSQYKASKIMIKRSIARISMQKGVFYFSGPDGSGKTTALDEVKDYFKKNNLPFIYLYTQHKILRSLGKRLSWVLYRVKTTDTKPQTASEYLGSGAGYLDRDPGNRSWKVLKFLGLISSLLDVYLGRLFLVFPNRLIGRTVFVETSPYDLFVKYHMPSFPMLESIVVPYIPKPDAGFLLTATPDQISSRKAELTSPEIELYYNKFWCLLGLANPHTYKAVEAASGVAPTVKYILQNILEQQGKAVDMLAYDTTARIDDFETVYQRDWRRIVRRKWKGNQNVIVKLWSRPDFKGVIRRLLNISSANYEWNNLRVLDNLGVRVPRPIGFINLGKNESSFTDVLIMEDLGKTSKCIDYLKKCILIQNEKEVSRIEAEVIDITVSMIKNRILDWDHSLVNMLVTQEGEVIRLDVEQARKIRVLTFNSELYSRMLGMLIVSYTYAVQPDLKRVNSFTDKLLFELRPSGKVLKLTQKRIDALLLLQNSKNGIDMKVTLKKPN